MPPLFRVVDEPLFRHDRDQPLPPLPLGRGDPDSRGMRLAVRTIIAGAHVDGIVGRPLPHVGDTVRIGLAGIERRRFRRRQTDQGQVDRRPGRVLGMLGDVPQPEQVRLAHSRIVVVLGWRLLAVLRPDHHLMHGARRAVAVIHL